MGKNYIKSSKGCHRQHLNPGVRVLWIREGRVARDETAFRHALKTGHRLRQAGKCMTDAAIIDAYAVSQEWGTDGRKNALPSMQDCQTMARRVQGYVTSSKGEVYGSVASGRTNSAEHKAALVTMVRRGGQKAAERWEIQIASYAQAELKKLEAANKRRSAVYSIVAFFDDAYSQTGEYPKVQEAAEHFRVSVRTVQRALVKTGIGLPTGRKKGDKL